MQDSLKRFPHNMRFVLIVLIVLKSLHLDFSRIVMADSHAVMPAISCRIAWCSGIFSPVDGWMFIWDTYEHIEVLVTK